MSPQESRTLWCILERDDNSKPYDVFDIPLDTRVNRLKVAIQDRIKALNGIDADNLKLLKLKKTVSVSPDRDLAQRLAKLGDIATWSEELNSADKVGVLFPDPHSEEELHIVVQISEPFTSRKRLLEEEDGQEVKRQKIDGDLAWLMEVHSKIWNGGEERLKTLVHKVEVTVAHYRELQQRLDARPNRDSDEDIPAIKREILLHYKPNHNTSGNAENVSEESGDDGSELELNFNTPDNEQVPADVNEESGDDNAEFDSFLPATFEFLDLSSLELKHKPSPNRLPLPLFIRPEYSFFLEDIRSRKKIDCSNSHMVSGQPGTGKTAFLHYMMIRYMLDGIPFLYQSIHKNVYHSEKVEIIEDWDLSNHIVAFVDADGENSNSHIPPEKFLHDRCVQFILASSPKGAKPTWTKQISGMYMLKWVVQLWTPQELFFTGIFLHPSHLDFAILRESTSYFGFNPRQCFQASISKADLKDHLLDVTDVICTIDNSVPLFELVKGTSTHIHIPHTVFELFPLNHNRRLAEAQIRATSQWALDQLLEVYNKRQANAALELYKMIAGIPSAEPLRDDMFQLWALKYFDTIDKPKTFKIRKLTTSTTSIASEYLDWCYPGPAPRRSFQTLDLTAVLKETVQQKQPRHLVPLAPNYAAVDSILYEPEWVLTGLQVTIKNQHPVAVSGLKRIQQSLKPNTSVAYLRPSTSNDKRWRLIFVVPEEVADSFGLQKFAGDTPKNAWAQKVDQYVLGLNVDEAFKN